MILARAAFALGLSLACLCGSADARGVGSPGVGPAGPQGVQGPKGDKGDVGAKGDAGPAGAPGATGQLGPAGPTGPAGKDGVAGAAGPKGDAGLSGAPGATGPQGPVGPAGPKASTFVCNATITETALLAISSGIRIAPATACAGVLTTDVLIAYPTSLASLQGVGGVSNGVAVHHAIPTAANTFRAVIQAPALALGASYSIPVAVYAVNR